MTALSSVVPCQSLPTFLPGKLVLGPGTRQDYVALERFHYLGKRPATWAAVWTVRYHRGEESSVQGQKEPSRVVAVAVLSYPVPRHRPRERHLGLGDVPDAARLRFANANLRTISRVIVHPQFRAIGLASVLVRWTCRHCPTRYVEASARMGRAHPLFEKGGMRAIPVRDSEPRYYLFDRGGTPQVIGA